MKHYYVKVTLETGEWTDGHAGGRCEDAELQAGAITFCLGVEARTKEDALTKATAAARTAIQLAAAATHRLGPDQLKLLDGDTGHRGEDARRKQLLRDRKPPMPWTLLSPAEIERYRSDEQFRREMKARWDSEWSPDDVNGAECWAVSVESTEVLLYPKECTFVFHGCWFSASGSGSGS
jgi:hypothetical protein